MEFFTKESLIEKLSEIVNMGWIPSGRQGNAGGIGNTLEDLLGIQENNLPLPNGGEWELKAQHSTKTPLTTLFHMEPSPRALKFVPLTFLPKYGWSHGDAGGKYGIGEKSFRQTINGSGPSDRGFQVKIDRDLRKVTISFDASKVSPRHSNWLSGVERTVGLQELFPQPYWGFDDLANKAGTKLINCFHVLGQVKKENGITLIKYERVTMLETFKFEGFLAGIEVGKIYVDFDARTGHNHGTKFRLKEDYLPNLYERRTVIIAP